MSRRINGNNPIMNSVYCGGRFDFDYQNEGYIEKATQDYRAILLGDVNLLLKSSSPVQISGNLLYVGPFYFETDGMLDQDIVETEIRQVIAYLIDENETESTLRSSCWYPIILCQKISSSEIQLLPYNNYSEGRQKILDYIQNELI